MAAVWDEHGADHTARILRFPQAMFPPAIVVGLLISIWVVSDSRF